MNCKNCGNNVEDKFCAHCGQAAKVGRLTFSSLLSEFSESILNVDKGFFFTLKSLSVNPGHVIRAYINGKRKNHFKPIAYLLILATLQFFITQVSGQNTFIDDFISGFAKGALDREGISDIPSALKWFSKNYAYATLLLIPIFSLSSFICFKKFGTNYLEHFVLNAYVAGHQAIVYSIFALLRTQFNFDEVVSISLFVSFSYALWVFLQFYREEKGWRILLRLVLTYILYLILSIGMLILVTGLIEIIG